MSDEPPMSRRNFLRGKVLRRAVSNLGDAIADGLAPLSDATAGSARSTSGQASNSRYHKSFPVLRPPGAIEEEAFLSGCTRCDACIEACPHDSILHAPSRFRRAAGTPMIDPLRQPCWMCEDTPCVAACEPAVLRQELPIKMGVAQISPVTCLAHQNSFCTVCSEQCPVEGAIEIVNHKPRINEDRCTGCGVCQHVCPAPENAVLLMPVQTRPPPPPPQTSPSPETPDAETAMRVHPMPRPDARTDAAPPERKPNDDERA